MVWWGEIWKTLQAAGCHRAGGANVSCAEEKKLQRNSGHDENLVLFFRKLNTQLGLRFRTNRFQREPPTIHTHTMCTEEWSKGTESTSNLFDCFSELHIIWSQTHKVVRLFSEMRIRN
jgi:hypothetical protein